MRSEEGPGPAGPGSLRRPLALTATLVGTLSLAACGSEAPEADTPAGDNEPVVLSLLGEPLTPRGDTTGAMDRALAALEADSSVDRILEAGHAYADAWDYVEAIRMYNRAVAAAPGDWRGFRYRGHRYVSIRRLPAALQDLEEARALEPLSFDVSYHLGLAYYLSGVFDAAADEYGRCMDLARDAEARAREASGELGPGFRSCMSIADSDNTRVAVTDWRVRALRRAGRHDEARALLADVTVGMEVGTNRAYHRALLFYGGHLSEAGLLDPDSLAGGRFETVGYPAAVWHLTEGDTARAVALLEQVAADAHWPGFGRIAAEADLAALRRAGVR